MQELTALLSEATVRIPHGYFQVQIDGGDPIYRERVYCYELYHQMRCLWPAETTYCLDGELDKSAHPILRKLGADHVKPDLLVHRPGHMSGNHAVVEVKTASAQAQGIEKDLRNLALFRTKVGYERAVYLIFGFEALAVLDQVRNVAQAMTGLPRIELWAHCHPQGPATYEGDAVQ